MIFLSLGSNIGSHNDKYSMLQQALDLLHQKDIRVKQISSLYRTSPVDYIEQPDFYNIVVVIETTLTPLELLGIILQVEQTLGRDRVSAKRFGPRVIDIDLLLYDSLVIDQPDLQVPHPRMCDRLFVLVPLFELVQEIKTPVLNHKSLQEQISYLESHTLQRLERLDQQLILRD